MAKEQEITSITFKRTSNIFINAGIVGLERFIRKFKIAYPNKYPSLGNCQLEEKKLVVECDQLLDFLEEVYYFMGKDIYDTPSQKQLDENYNVYYIEQTDEFKRFPKMNTYGLTHLFTNNAQGNTQLKENSPKITNLEKDKPELAAKIKKYFESNNIKLLSKVYLNEPYTKITRLETNKKYFQEGKKKCPILGESFKTLVEAKNVSPFASGIGTFNSFLKTSEKHISLKAMYLIRFAPALCYFSYQNNYETIICNFFNSNTLKNLASLYATPMFRQKEEMAKITYLLNFKLKDFSIKRKGAEEITIETRKDAVWESEIAFMLLYTFYKDQFEGEILDQKNQEEDFQNETTLPQDFTDPFADNPLDEIPISLITFRADTFAQTLRPNSYEEYNNVKYILRLIYKLESGGITFQPIWQGLKLNSPKAKIMKSKPKTFGKGKAVERQIRASVLGKILKGKTIINDIEKLFFDSYKILIANDNPGFRKYSKILAFLLLYEKSLNHKNMDPILQEKSVKLGKQIAGNILKYENEKGDPKLDKANAKNGRKDIIKLHKSRTVQQFTEALIRIMKKYSLSNNIIEIVNKDNFIMIRQYSVIGALNVLNAVLSSSQNN